MRYFRSLLFQTHSANSKVNVPVLLQHLFGIISGIINVLLISHFLQTTLSGFGDAFST